VCLHCAAPRLCFFFLYNSIHILQFIPIYISACRTPRSLRSSGRWNNGGKTKKKGNLTVTWQATSAFFLVISMKYCAHPKCPHVGAIRCRPNYIAADPTRSRSQSDPNRSEWRLSSNLSLPDTCYRSNTCAPTQNNKHKNTKVANTKQPATTTGNSQQQRQPVAGTTITTNSSRAKRMKVYFT